MNNNFEQIDALLNHLHTGNEAEAENVFNALMQEKVDAILNAGKQEVAASMFNTEDCGECEETNEALKGGQHKIDANKNGKIDAQDFKMLRAKKGMKEEVEQVDEAKFPAEFSPSLKRQVVKSMHGSKPGNTDSVKTKTWRKRVQALNLTPDEQIPSRKQLAKIERNKMQKEAYADPYAAKKAAEMKKKKEEQMAAAKKEYEASQESKGKVNTKSFMKMKEEVESVEESKYSLPPGSMKPAKPVYKGSYLEKRFGHLKPGESASLKGDPKKVMKKEEVEQMDEASYSAKMARAGKDIGKPGKMFKKIAAKASRKYGKDRGAKIAGAVLAKLRSKKGK